MLSSYGVNKVLLMLYAEIGSIGLQAIKSATASKYRLWKTVKFDPLTGTPITEEACDQLVVEPNTGIRGGRVREKLKSGNFRVPANPVKLKSQRMELTSVLAFLYSPTLKRTGKSTD